MKIRDWIYSELEKEELFRMMGMDEQGDHTILVENEINRMLEEKDRELVPRIDEKAVKIIFHSIVDQPSWMRG